MTRVRFCLAALRCSAGRVVAVTAAGRFVEVQGAAENGQGFDRETMNRLLDLGVRGCEGLMSVQRRALGDGGYRRLGGN